MRFQAGIPTYFGPRWHGKQLHLALHAPFAHTVELLLFKWGEASPFITILLDPSVHRTGTIWHVAFEPAELPLEYAYRLDGADALVGDPYAPLLGSRRRWRTPGNEAAESFARGVLLPPETFDWQGVTAPVIPRDQLVIYEAHVRAFTMSDTKNHAPGTYAGFCERLDHLKNLGINAIELMPLLEFDELEYHRHNPNTGEPLCQFWGYSHQNFFAPMRRFAASGEDPAGPMVELQTLVRECHRRGLLVILDLVYNHTAWPNCSWGQLDPVAYYLRDPDGGPTNYSGCGNTVGANHPITRRLILDSLRHLVATYHVDGFRFDLTACLWRGPHGGLLPHPPIIEEMETDPLLRNTLLIAEPWDAAGAYQVGGTYSTRWMQWNGSFRDVVRRFAKGDRNQSGLLATRLCGSQDLFDRRGPHPLGGPQQSINFITCHDGFTLADLVSYNHKHNLANGEDDRDGCSHNDSWNCGTEGPTQDVNVKVLRDRQRRKLLIMLLTAQGIPMLLMGDEVGFSRGGNNNTWCQDNELNAMPWGEHLIPPPEMSLIQELLALRRSCEQFRSQRFLGSQDVTFQSPSGHGPDWSPDAPLVAFILHHEARQFFLAFSRSHDMLTLQLPPLPEGERWIALLGSELPLAPLDCGLWEASRSGAPAFLSRPDTSTPE